VAQCAGDAEARQLPGIVHTTAHAEDGVQPQQFDRDRRVCQVDRVAAQRRDDRSRQRLDVDFQTDGQRRRRSDGRHDLVHPQHAGP
jgi:hypothetical protein